MSKVKKIQIHLQFQRVIDELKTASRCHIAQRRTQSQCRYDDGYLYISYIKHRPRSPEDRATVQDDRRMEEGGSKEAFPPSATALTR